MTDKMTSIEEIFDSIPEHFNPDAAAGVDVVVQFDLSGENGGKYWVKVADQQVEVHQGETTEPTLTIVASADNYLSVINGDLAATTAFMQGKVKIKGNMGLAMKLQSIFGL